MVRPCCVCLVREEERERFRMIERTIAELGGACLDLSLTGSRWQEREIEGLAVIAMRGSLGQDAAGLALIRDLRQRGIPVLSYADGARDAPVALRCRVLLAGAQRILDSGADEFRHELPDLLRRLHREQHAHRAEDAQLRETMARNGVIGRSRAMMDLFRALFRMSALSDVPVQIHGESGTGKELLARALHQLDRKRSRGPFIAVNCGAISPALAEGELFGHRRGAFTGAEYERRGLIRAAHGGVLLLDEVGELDAGLQTKLLRVLQEGKVLGVGEDHEAQVDVRVVAAAHRDLSEMVKKGRFREDLYYRLNVLTLRVPPLRSRSDDLHPLIEHFLCKHSAIEVGCTSASPEFIQALVHLRLPGNARQLENLVRRALLGKVDPSPLGLEDLSPETWEELAFQEDEPAAPPTSSESLMGLLDRNGWNLARSLCQCEKQLLQIALQASHGNQSQTARVLGITPRCVYNKLRKHQLLS